ncbi:MAG: hypothetical protein KKE05_05915 [Nanoarchaeota archaeon]|nr:hypothetical protein [Nanoarchaeota archaeon]
MNYSFGYLVGSLALILVWIIIFFWRKDVRKEMILISLIFGALGPFLSPIFLSDWWRPPTITGTPVGVEDFLFGFAVGGIGSVIYMEIFHKKLRLKKPTKKKEKKRNIRFGLLFGLGALAFFILYLLGLHSFPASIIAATLAITIIWIQRPDLILDSLISGILLTLVSLIFYILPEFLFPGWINYTWNFNSLTGITFLKAPIEDLVWFFFSGMLVGPTYEYWKEGKIINQK